MKGHRPERIECLVYGRLIAIVLITILYGFASWYAESQFKREASLHKLIDWLKRKERLTKAVLCNSLDVLLMEMTQDLPKMLCKQKRKRKTTLELIENQVPYEYSFSNEDSYLLLKDAA